MFTGIVEELGTVLAVAHHDGGAGITIGATVVLDDAEVGASIAVNGVCLTVVEFDPAAHWWRADAVTETLQRSNLGDLTPGDRVNLERPLRAGDRLGGHIVQGHVDATGEIVSTNANPDGSVDFTFAAPPGVLRHVVEKGSITIDGISLTVVDVGDDRLSVAVIPHTLAVTTLGFKRRGDRVNLECDIVAKHVARLVEPWLERGGPTGR